MCEMYDVINPSPEARKYMQELGNGFCIAYFQHEVLVGLWDHVNKKPRFVGNPDWKRLLEVRVFNEDVECRFVKTSGGYRARIADDRGKNEDEFFDETMLIIGSKNPEDLKNGFVRATESGRVIILPEEEKGKAIKIRNYLSFEKIYDDTTDEDSNEEKLPISEVMRVKDWRYVGFVDEGSAEEVHVNA